VNNNIVGIPFKRHTRCVLSIQRSKA
jgi:hypothetical protein